MSKKSNGLGSAGYADECPGCGRPDVSYNRHGTLAKHSAPTGKRCPASGHHRHDSTTLVLPCESCHGLPWRPGPGCLDARHADYPSPADRAASCDRLLKRLLEAARGAGVTLDVADDGALAHNEHATVAVRICGDSYLVKVLPAGPASRRWHICGKWKRAERAVYEVGAWLAVATNAAQTCSYEPEPFGLGYMQGRGAS